MQLNNKGLNNARGFVHDVASSYDIIYKGKGLQLILSKAGKTTNDVILYSTLISFISIFLI